MGKTPLYPAMDSKDLIRQHPERKAVIDEIKDIDLLVGGGESLIRNAIKFVHKRTDEGKTSYQNRLKRAKYDNDIGDAIDTISSRFLTGSVTFDNENETWENWRKNVDGKNTSEMNFLAACAVAYQSYGRFWVFVNSSDFSGAEIISAKDYEEMQFPANLHLLTYKNVYDWSYYENGSLEWVKVISRKIVSSVKDDPKIKFYFKYIYRDRIECYETTVPYSDSLMSELPKDFEPIESPGFPKPLQRVSHPVVDTRYKNKSEWAADQALSIAKAHFDGSTSNHDTLINAGWVSKSYEKPADSDLEETFEDEKPKRNEFFPGKVSFNEFSGNALTSVRSELDQYAKQIRYIVLTAGSSSVDKEILQQSGIAKGYDLSKEELALLVLGIRILDSYRKVIRLVSDILNLPVPNISGLNNFKLDELGDAIDNLTKLTNEQIVEYIEQDVIDHAASRVNQAAMK